MDLSKLVHGGGQAVGSGAGAGTGEGAGQRGPAGLPGAGEKNISNKS